MRLFSTSELMPYFLPAMAAGAAIKGTYDEKPDDFLGKDLLAAISVFSAAFFFAELTQNLVNKRIIQNVQVLSKTDVSHIAKVGSEGLESCGIEDIEGHQEPLEYRLGSHYSFLLNYIQDHPLYEEAIELANKEIDDSWGGKPDYRCRAMISYPRPTGWRPGNQKLLENLVGAIEYNKVLKDETTINTMVTYIKNTYPFLEIKQRHSVM